MGAGNGGVSVVRDADELLDRERELSLLRAAATRAAAGEGGMVVLEGAPGIGKSRLLAELARDLAEPPRVVRAHCQELDRALPWSLAASLLSPLIDAMRPAQRRAALARAGEEASVLLSTRAGDRSSDPARLLRRAHALTWLVSDMAQEAPLALLVDDLHWADEPSMHFLAYLAARAGALPLLIVLTQRPPQNGPEPPPQQRMAALHGVQVLMLAPLTSGSVAKLASAELGELADGVPLAFEETTGGNPYYVHELIRAVAEQQERGVAVDAESVRAAAPSSVVRSVRARLGRLGADAVALARATAVLGEDGALAQAAELAGLDETRAVSALDMLAAEHILASELPLRFVHPLVASAVNEDIGPADRGLLHLAAAKLLSAEGAELARVAAHLPEALPRGDPWVVQTLREAARLAVIDAAAPLGARYLARALDEPPASEERASVLTELGCIEATLGSDLAARHLGAALEVTSDPEHRARLLLEAGRSHLIAGDPARAAKAFREGARELGDPSCELGCELRAASWMAQTLHRGERSQALASEQAAVEDAPEPLTRGQRQLLAQLSQQRAFEGQSPKDLRRLALRAWGDGELLHSETSDGLTWSLVTGALVVADELELELGMCEAVLADARVRGSPMAYATASYVRSWPLFHRGQVDEAAADAQAALAARPDGWHTYVGAATASQTVAMVERGDLAEARRRVEEAIADPQIRQSTEFGLLLWADGRLLIAEEKPAEALDALLAAGELCVAIGADRPSIVPWRSDGAIAAAQLGETARSRMLAQDALALGEQSGIARDLAAALRARARTESTNEAIDTLSCAAQTLDGRPPRLETAYVLVELGAALRRGHRRAEARTPLVEGLRLARGGGARRLASLAETELAAAGVRVEPRTPSEDGSLTPSERRVALLAAEGHSNRQIAQMLFVTVKAVEYHLSNTYSKLGIRRRAQLARALGSP